jgi:hypothetical protein
MPKKITMSFADACKYQPPNPERTARKSLSFDVTFQEWSNREAMARSIRMQSKRECRNDDWRAVVPLTDGEGY